MNNPLTSAIADSIRSNWTKAALSDYKGATLTYGETADRIARMKILFKAAGIKPGDKVAICAKNSAEWAVTFLGAMTCGAIVVPLLHEFNPATIEHLVSHSEARLLFTEKSISDNLDVERMGSLEGIVMLSDHKVPYTTNPKLADVAASLEEALKKIYPDGITPDDMKATPRDPDEIALINYTSGSMGNSKGVMITYRNLWSNISFALSQIDFLKPGDTMLSMLPLAHMYGLVFEFLFPFCRGCHITFLGRVPSPKVVLDAFAQTRPQLVITVPLVIEKIVKTKIFPVLRKPAMRVLLAIPGLRGLIFSKIRRQLTDAFGGNLRQLIIGGAAMTKEVENFLRKIKFPFTIGYGMTECAPLVTYAWWAEQRPGSCGKIVPGMQAKVESADPVNEAGVLFVKGDNVMKGYFKNPEETAAALDADGWLNTGDTCTIDADGYVYIRGRKKNMILGASGQNIYPEEIEVVLNNLPLVAESIVVDRGGKIVALVHPDYEAGRKEGLTEQQTEEKVLGERALLNKQIPAYARVAEFEIRREEFEKTPKHSIRRFLYS